MYNISLFIINFMDKCLIKQLNLNNNNIDNIVELNYIDYK